MPMKPDGKGRRCAELVFDMPGTPEEIWQAIATGPGVSAWFVPTTVEQREGGKVAFDLGGGNISEGRVTAWRPPHRIAYEEPDWNPEAPPLVTEFVVETDAGGQCRVRVVMSLETEDDRWDGEVGSMEAGWTPFFHVMRIYLGHFAGQRAASLRPTAMTTMGLDEAWRRFREALGVGSVGVGGRTVTAAHAPRLAGVVERETGGDRQKEFLVRLEAPGPGVALPGAWSWDGKTHLGISLFFYGDDCEALAAEQGPLWEAWLASLFPKPD